MELSDEMLGKLLLKVSQNIRRERMRRGMSMAHLAVISNLSVSHISKVENAQCEIGLKALLKISTALGMEVIDFLPYDSIQDMHGEDMSDNGGKHEAILTNGERFEEIVQDASPQSVEFILKMTACMRKVFDEKRFL